MYAFKECDSTLNKIYLRLIANGFAFARTALSKQIEIVNCTLSRNIIIALVYFIFYTGAMHVSNCLKLNLSDLLIKFIVKKHASKKHK